MIGLESDKKIPINLDTLFKVQSMMLTAFFGSQFSQTFSSQSSPLIYTVIQLTKSLLYQSNSFYKGKH